MKKIIVLTMLILGLSSFVLHMTLFFRLTLTSPQHPIVATGHTYVLQNHYDVYYVTKQDEDLLNYLMYLFVILGFGAGILNFYWKVFTSPYDKEPSRL